MKVKMRNIIPTTDSLTYSYHSCCLGLSVNIYETTAGTTTIQGGLQNEWIPAQSKGRMWTSKGDCV